MKTLWQLPIPSSWEVFPTLEQRPGRTLVLSFAIDEENRTRGSITFEGVIAYRCTYLDALTPDLIEGAYDRLVDVESSEWLTQGRRTRRDDRTPGELRHLRICFDDGPCYEFLCTSFLIDA